MEKVLEDFEIKEKNFYLSKIKKYQATAEKSEELIQRNRELKTHLQNQGFKTIRGGIVRGHFENNGKPHFHEKGVDVKIAVDMITLSLVDKKADRIILASSDSDLQPAIKLIRRRGDAELVYLGFEISPNKGLAYTTDKKRLIKGPEISRAYKKQLKFRG